MRVLRIIVGIIVLGFLIKGVANLYFQANNLKSEVRKLSDSLQKIETKNKFMKDKIKYLSNPENLIKEIKSRFNYLKPGEKMIILPPTK